MSENETALAAECLASTLMTFTLLALDVEGAAATIETVESELGLELDDATLEAAVMLYNGYTQQAAQRADDALAAFKVGGGQA